jgi:hypothetical protein
MENYSMTDKKECVADLVTITLENDNIPEKKIAGGGAPGIGDIIGPAATLALDITNNVITNQQAEYTASYSNTALLTLNPSTIAKLEKAATYDTSTNAIPGDNSSYMLVIRRNLLLNSPNNYINTSVDPSTSPIATEFFFKVHEFDSTGIQFRLARVNFLYSKARFKVHNELKDFLSISLDIKKSTGAGAGSASSGQSGSSGSLGESTILIPIIRTNDTKSPLDIDRSNKIVGNTVFKGLSQAALTSGQTTLLNFSVTVSEANVSHIKPSAVDNFLKSNGSDLTGLIKALFPSSSGNSGKGGGSNGSGSN